MRLQTEEPSQEQHVDSYIAALMTPLGIWPILDSADLVAVLDIQDKIQNDGEAALIYGLSTRAFTPEQYMRKPWLSGGGIASTDGGALFDLKKVRLAESSRDS